jgi:hypothetical protein
VAIGGITSNVGAGGLTPNPARGTTVAAERPAHLQVPAQAAQAAAVAELEGGLPMQAPAGIDPELWSVLTAEERQFFGKMSALGPLTYGPRSANVPPGMVRGGRIDRTV